MVTRRDPLVQHALAVLRRNDSGLFVKPGLPLRPDVEALRRTWIAVGKRPVRELSVAEARAAERAELEQRGEPESVGEVFDGSLPGPAGPTPIRVY